MAISRSLLRNWDLLVASCVSDTAGCIVGLDGVNDDFWLMMNFETPEIRTKAWDAQ